MSKRLLTDDKLEDEELTQQQAIVAAILTDTVAEIGQMVHVFRFHPIRFLHLLKTSINLNNAVARAERSGGAFAIWYKMCLYSFPDYVIALKACDFRFLPKTGFDHDNDGNRFAPGWSECRLPDLQRRGVHYLFGFTQGDQDYPPYWNNTALEKEDVSLHVIDDAHWGLWRRLMDRSFSSGETRMACLRDPAKTKDMAQYFHLVFPLSVPPAEYCMSSAVTRYKLAMEFLHLLVDTENGTSCDSQTCREVFQHWVEIMEHDYTLHPRVISTTEAFYSYSLCYASVDDFDLWRETQRRTGESSLHFTGEGRSRRPVRKFDRTTILMNSVDPNVSFFTVLNLAKLVLYASRRLRDLMKSVTDHVGTLRLTNKITQCRSIYERCALAYLRHTSKYEEGLRTLVAFESKYHMDYSESMFPTPFTTTYDWQAERAADLELYDTHDPLYWDVLLRDLKRMEDIAWVESLSPSTRAILVRNNQQAFELYSPPGAWKQALLDMLHLFVKDKYSEEYRRMSSPMPTNITIECAHCNSLTPKIAQIQAPFHAYCDKKCQRDALLAERQ